MYNGLNGDLYAVLVFDRWLTPFEQLAASGYFFEKLGVVRPDIGSTRALVLDGNSISSINATPHLLPDLMGDPSGTYNLAWGGKTGVKQLKYMSEDIIPLLSYLRTRGANNLGFYLNEGTNELPGTTPELAASHQLEILKAVKPYVDFEVAGTLLDRGSTPGFPEKRAIYNIYLRSASTALDYSVADFDSIAMGKESSASSVWLAGDSVHPNEPYSMDDTGVSSEMLSLRTWPRQQKLQQHGRHNRRWFQPLRGIRAGSLFCIPSMAPPQE